MKTTTQHTPSPWRTQNRLALVQLDQREADCLREFLYICSDADDRGLESILTTPEAIARTAALWESEYGQHPLDAEELALVSTLAGMDADALHITSNE